MMYGRDVYKSGSDSDGNSSRVWLMMIQEVIRYAFALRCMSENIREVE